MSIKSKITDKLSQYEPKRYLAKTLKQYDFGRYNEIFKKREPLKPPREAFDVDAVIEQRKNARVAKTQLWRVELPALSEHPVNVTGSSSFERAAVIADDDYFFRFDSTRTSRISNRIVEISTPTFTFDVDKRIFHSKPMYHAEIGEVGGMSIVIEEDEDSDTMKYFQQWKRMIRNDDTFVYNPPYFYKRQIKFYRLNSMHMEFQVFTYDGYFPSEITPITNTYGDSGILRYNVAFSGDKLTVDYYNLRELEAGYQFYEDALMDYRIYHDPLKTEGDVGKLFGKLEALVKDPKVVLKLPSKEQVFSPVKSKLPFLR